MSEQQKPSAAAVRIGKQAKRGGYINSSDHADILAAIADAEIQPLIEALEKLKSYNEAIRDGQINYRPEDHIFVAESALAHARGAA